MINAPARVVLLGASNLTRGISTVVESAGLRLGRPLHVLAALGHGRSYGMKSRVFARTLPAIIDCGLWEALAATNGNETSAPPATFGLITDVGNDILYGAAPERIAEWVERCVNRLEDAGARIVMTHLPLASVRDLSRWRFALVRRVAFPRCSMSYATAIDRAFELDERLSTLAKRHGIEPVSMPAAWYGVDPIHIRMRWWPEAWRSVLRGWTDAAPPPVTARANADRWLRLRLGRPQHAWWFRREVRREQPAVRLLDATTVSLF